MARPKKTPIARKPSDSKAKPSKRKPSPAKKRSSNCTDDDSSSAKDAKNPRVQSVIRLDPPFKPSTDSNDYRLIQLPNGIIALLISSLAPQTPAWNQRTYNHFHDQTRIPLVGSLFFPKRNLLITPERILGPTSEVLLDPFLLNERIPGRKLPEIDSLLVSKKAYKARGAKAPDAFLSQRSTAIAMTINVGSCNDPPNHKGLAHFCEHMVHFGSKKFKKEDTYMKFAFDNGSMNAFTQCMTTTYHFAVPEDCLEKGLDIFSNMMAFPLFEAECIGREVNSVDNEWNLHRTSDSEAHFSILLSITNQGHPLNGFLCGNLQTLLHPQDCNGLQDLQAALQAYHKKFYVGSAMTFAVQSSASLDRMEKLVVDSLTKISEGDQNIRQLRKLEEALKSPFDNPCFNKLYVIKARQTHRHLILTWALPPEAWQNWENKPMNLLEVLMNDEWTGGLPYHLRKQGLIISYSARCPPYDLFRNDYTTLFQLEFVLTSKGLRDWSEIIKAVFGYLKRLQVTPLNQKIALWNELRNSSAKSFYYSSPGDDETLTIESARLLQSIPGKHIFTAGCINGDSYDDNVFMKYLDLLTPSGMNAMLIIPSHEPIFKQITFNLIEPYTSTEYKVTGFNDSFMKTLKEMKPLPNVSIIPPNPLMSVCTEVADLGFIDYQRIALGTEKLIAIHFGHNMLPAKVFKARCVTLFASNAIKNNTRNLAYLSIWGKCLQNLLLSDVSGIKRSGVDVRIGAIPTGDLIFFDLCGFAEMFTSALKNILIKIFNQVGFITEDTFQLVHEDMINVFIAGMGNKFFVLQYIVQELVTPNGPSLEDHLRTLQSCSYKGFLAFIELFKSSCYGFLGLFENVSVKDGQSIAEVINRLNYSPVSKDWVPSERSRSVISLPFDDRCIRVRSTVTGDRNTLVLNAYQLAHASNYKVGEISIFLAACMKARAFQILRTEKQLGYIVMCGDAVLLNSITLLILVVAPSDKHCACKVDQEIDGFLASFFHRYLKVMTNDEFRNLQKKLQLSGSIQLDQIVSWYENNLLAAVKVDEKTGQGKWQDKTGKRGKLSFQVLGSDEENCQTVERCLASGWAEKPVCGTQKILFVKDSPDTKVPYFVDSIKKFRNSITK